MTFSPITQNGLATLLSCGMRLHKCCAAVYPRVQITGIKVLGIIGMIYKRDQSLASLIQTLAFLPPRL